MSEIQWAKMKKQLDEGHRAMIASLNKKRKREMGILAPESVSVPIPDYPYNTLKQKGERND